MMKACVSCGVILSDKRMIVHEKNNNEVSKQRLIIGVLSFAYVCIAVYAADFVKYEIMAPILWLSALVLPIWGMMRYGYIDHECGKGGRG